MHALILQLSTNKRAVCGRWRGVGCGKLNFDMPPGPSVQGPVKYIWPVTCRGRIFGKAVEILVPQGERDLGPSALKSSSDTSSSVQISKNERRGMM